MIAKKTLAAIDAKLEQEQEREHRTYLGASMLGEECSRKIFYAFRWAVMELFGGRMLRLFKRGHREEPEVISYLEGIGCKIWSIDPNTGKQWRFHFGNGHCGGGTDGIGVDLPDLDPGVPFDLEIKTMKAKLFRELQRKGLCQTNPKHFAQIQTYMAGWNLSWGLYVAVNKDDDAMHMELVGAQPLFARNLFDKADRIVTATEPPPKISGKSGASFFKCKTCKFRDVCHNGTPPERNCRTCRFSKPIDGGVWICTKFDNFQLNKEQQHWGCAEWRVSPIFG